MLEIERQFLVKVALLPELQDPHAIVQAYLSVEPEVRVRIIDDGALLTVKSGGDFVREEYEYAIPIEDARSLMRLSPYSPIEKQRFRLELDDIVWEIDSYAGDNAGLWSAEVELSEGNQEIKLPAWLGEEITLDSRFKNKNLGTTPLIRWPDRESVLRRLA
jgi:adenylate cyclase